MIGFKTWRLACAVAKKMREARPEPIRLPDGSWAIWTGLREERLGWLCLPHGKSMRIRALCPHGIPLGAFCEQCAGEG